MQNTLEWELSHVLPGSEVLIKDHKGRQVARGILGKDHKTILGHMGEKVRVDWQKGWQMVIVRKKNAKTIRWSEWR